MKYLSRILTITLVITALCECNRVSPEESSQREAKEKALKFLRDNVMKTYYYWNTDVPNLGYSYETDIYDYFDNLLVPQDRWSWMMDGPTYVADNEGTVTLTYGASIGQPIEYYDDYSVCVRYVYPGSPFDKAGVRRGWIITGIDGEETSSLIISDKFTDLFFYPSTNTSHRFTFTTPEGTVETRDITATPSLSTRPGLVKKIFTDKDYPGLTEPVGYFHYLAFKAEKDPSGKPMIDDIVEAMDYFAANDIKKLILDIRYNGGGDSRASDTLVSYLAPAASNNEIYVRRYCNGILGPYYNENTTVHIAADKPEFDRIYFITGKSSASASEMVLNGLKPLADIQHVGDTTYGKPNGMFVFLYPNDLKAYDYDDYSRLEWVFLPICFYNLNGKYEYIPDDGMIPDNYRPDDLFHDFDASEDNIAACLHHVAFGRYPRLPELKRQPKTRSAAKGVKIPLTEEERCSEWGTYTIKM